VTTRFLLDTNILSELVRHPRGFVRERLAQVGEAAVCTSVIVAAELHFGARKSASRRLAERVDLILATLEVLSLEEAVAGHYAEIRYQLERAGTPIGPNDLLIAAHARAVGLCVVTANLQEFSRVPSLAVENWLPT
jgi:tRNA(fMet)-specific endonuclease VapC